MTRAPVEDDIRVAAALASELGLGRVQPRLLKAAKHTTLHLAPYPIVMRMRAAEPRSEAALSLTREVGVASALSGAGAPVVSPAVEVDPGPYFRGGLGVSLWRLVVHRPAGEADAPAALAALTRLHQSMAGAALELPTFTAEDPTCDALLADQAAMPDLSSDDRAFLGSEYARLCAAFRRASFRPAPLHGDTHFGNALITDDGVIWADLEAACLGPVENDRASFSPAALRGRAGVNEGLLSLSRDLASARVALWCWGDLQRNPDMAPAARFHLERLKRRHGRAGRK